MAVSSAPLIEIRGLCYRYQETSFGVDATRRGLPALRGMDLAVSRERRLAILGPNGAGKTTLFLHLNGTLRPTAGEIRLEGQPADYTRTGLREWRRKVGLVFQNPDDQLFAPTVREDLSFGPLNLGLSRAEVEARVEETIALLGLERLCHRAPWTLSQGQKRRVSIGGVVAMRPPLLILDEPLAGLDLAGIEQLVRLMAQIEQTGVTIVLATHDIDFAAEWADEVAIVGEGRTLRQGAAEEILADRELLRKAGLAPPLIFEVATRLHKAGLLPATVPLPRRRTELLALLDQLPGCAGGPLLTGQLIVDWRR